MKTFIQYLRSITGISGTNATPRYKGTPVVVDTHGSHAKDKPPTYKGTPVVVDTHGGHSENKRKSEKLDEKSELSSVEGQSEDWFSQNDNIPIGRSHTILHSNLSVMYHHDDFSPQHKNAVDAYTEGSTKLNKALLDHYVSKSSVPERVGAHSIEHLDGVVNHHKLSHDLHVYSGVGFHPGEKASKDPESKIHLPAYTSTSVHKKTAVVFSSPLSHVDGVANHVLHIHLKKGQKGLYVGDHSAVGNEYEYLLPRHTTLKVHPKPTILPPGSHFSNKEPVHVWHAHVVPNEPSDPRQIPLDLKDRQTKVTS